MPSAVPSGTFNSAMKPTTRATTRAHSSRCSKPQPAKKPDRSFRQDQPSDDAEQRPQPDRDLGRRAVWNVDHVTEDRLRDNKQDHSCNHVQRRIRHPENAHQPHMFAHPAAPQLDESQHGLAATSAACVSRLQLRSTLIAKHRVSSRAHTLVHCIVRMSAQTVPKQFSVLSSQ